MAAIFGKKQNHDPLNLFGGVNLNAEMDLCPGCHRELKDDQECLNSACDLQVVFARQCPHCNCGAHKFTWGYQCCNCGAKADPYLGLFEARLDDYNFKMKPKKILNPEKVLNPDTFAVSILAYKKHFLEGQNLD